jgi:hypothetical protein
VGVGVGAGFSSSTGVEVAVGDVEGDETAGAAEDDAQLVKTTRLSDER